MNLGIYGHSLGKWDKKLPFSFITKLKEHYNANIVNSGCGHGSEERILFELKKTKNLDLAIIFHSNSSSFFIPTWHRDVDSFDQDYLLKTVGTTDLADMFKEVAFHFNNEAEFKEAIDIIKQTPNAAALNFASAINLKPFLEHLNLWNTKGPAFVKELITQITKDGDPNFYKELFESLVLNKQYLWNPDLQKNRFEGALVLIDQYLDYRQIPVVHCLSHSSDYPTWFNFKSGIVDSEIFKMQWRKDYYTTQKFTDNSVNEIGNEAIFQAILPLTVQAIEKVKCG